MNFHKSPNNKNNLSKKVVTNSLSGFRVNSQSPKSSQSPQSQSIQSSIPQSKIDKIKDSKPLKFRSHLEYISDEKQASNTDLRIDLQSQIKSKLVTEFKNLLKPESPPTPIHFTQYFNESSPSSPNQNLNLSLSNSTNKNENKTKKNIDRLKLTKRNANLLNHSISNERNKKLLENPKNVPPLLQESDEDTIEDSNEITKKIDRVINKNQNNEINKLSENIDRNEEIDHNNSISNSTKRKQNFSFNLNLDSNLSSASVNSPLNAPINSPLISPIFTNITSKINSGRSSPKVLNKSLEKKLPFTNKNNVKLEKRILHSIQEVDYELFENSSHSSSISEKDDEIEQIFEHARRILALKKSLKNSDEENDLSEASSNEDQEIDIDILKNSKKENVLSSIPSEKAMDPNDESLVEKLLEDSISGIQELEQLSNRMSFLENSLKNNHLQIDSKLINKNYQTQHDNNENINDNHDFIIEKSTNSTQFNSNESIENLDYIDKMKTTNIKSNPSATVDELYEIIGYLERRLEQEREFKSSIMSNDRNLTENISEDEKYQELKSRYKTEQEIWNKERIELLKKINQHEIDQPWKLQYQQLLDKFQKESQTFNSLNLQLKEQLEVLTAENASLIEENHQLQQKAQQYEENKKQSIIFSNDLELLQQKLISANQEIIDLHSKIQELENNNAADESLVYQQLSESTNQITQLERSLSDLSQKFEIEKDTSIKLREDNVTLKRHLEELIKFSGNDIATEYTKKLQKENTKLKEILEGLNEELETFEELQVQNEKLAQSLKKQKEENNQLRNLLQKTKNTGSAYTSTLKDENEELKKQIKKFQQKLNNASMSEEIGPNLRIIL